MTRVRKVTVITAGAVLLVIGVALSLNWDRLVAIYEFRQRFDSLGENAQGYDEYLHRQTGIVSAHLPGGTFLMGDPNAPNDRKGFKQEAQHEVRLSAFLMAKFEVPQSDWSRAMKDNPSRIKGDTLGKFAWLARSHRIASASTTCTETSGNSAGIRSMNGSIRVPKQPATTPSANRARFRSPTGKC